MLSTVVLAGCGKNAEIYLVSKNILFKIINKVSVFKTDTLFLIL